MLETKPLELIYQGPTNTSQVLSPFSASPPKVLLSGFRSRCHIVIKGAFPEARVHQGLAQLIRLYTSAGFPKEDLQSISEQLLTQHQNCAVKVLVSFQCITTHMLHDFWASCGLTTSLLLLSKLPYWCYQLSWNLPQRFAYSTWFFSPYLIANIEPWITHKDELFTIISPEPLCISTTWPGSYPFSSLPLNLMMDHPILLLRNRTLSGVSTPLFRFHPITTHQVWPPMGDFPQGSSPIQNSIYVPLRHIHLTGLIRFRHIIAITRLFLAQHRVHPLCRFIQIQWRTHIQNLVHFRTYQKLHPDRQSRYLSDPSKEVTPLMIHNPRRNRKQRNFQPPSPQILIDPRIHIIQLWIMMTPMIQTPVICTAWQLFDPTKQWWHPDHGNLGAKQHQKPLHR